MVKKILLGVVILFGAFLVAKPQIPLILDTWDILSGRGTVSRSETIFSVEYYKDGIFFKCITRNPEASENAMRKKPIDVVKLFYSTCGLKDDPLLTESLKERFEKSHSHNLTTSLTCSQNPPRRAVFKEKEVLSDKAVFISEHYLNDKRYYPNEIPNAIYIYLVKYNGQWKIDDVKQGVNSWNKKVYSCISL